MSFYYIYSIMKHLIIILSLLTSTVYASTSDIIKNLTPLIGTIDKNNIMPSKMPGIYEVVTTNPIDSIFVSENGKFIIQGDVIDLDARSKLAKSPRVKELIKQEIDAIDDKDKIIFKAKDEKYVVHVFTDVDCPFCARLHAQMDEMNKLGITVKYLASPLASLHPRAQSQMEKIWCAEDRVKAMDEYKKHKTIPNSKDCANPVAEQLKIAEKVGVNGTPSIFLSDGTHISGYLPTSALLQRIKAVE